MNFSKKYLNLILNDLLQRPPLWGCLRNINALQMPYNNKPYFIASYSAKRLIILGKVIYIDPKSKEVEMLKLFPAHLSYCFCHLSCMETIHFVLLLQDI